MKKLVILVLLLTSITSGFSQVQRALVIGIDTYEPPADAKISASSARISWPKLDGCKNDADLVKQVIISRFSFPEKNVQEIVNYDATRENILKGMENLLKESQQNDIAFIYYAGHGSQVKNSMSAEKDKKDESMVPVDTWKEGVADIRDKELAKMFNRFIDKGVKLTIIYDCCHSGSIARGLYPSKSRFIAESNYDAKDNSAPVPPETRKKSSYLIMSAAQDNEFAQEQFDDVDSAHGAFTLALMKAMDQQSVTTSAQNLFTGLRAVLKSNGKSQEPVLAGDIERFDQTLFGIDKAKLSDKKLFSILDVKGNVIILQGGLAAGINVGNELTSVNGGTKIRVTGLLGISQSEAIIVSGAAGNIKPGELMEVTNWVASSGPLLKIYVPGGKYSYEDVQKLAAVNAELKKSTNVKWINTFDKDEPDISVNVVNNKYIVNNYAMGQAGTKELKDYSAASINTIAKGKNLFVNLPAVTNLVAALQAKLSVYKTIQIVTNPSEAQYVLYGTIDANNKVAYGLMKSEISARDAMSSMPLYTAYYPLANNTDEAYRVLVDSLFEASLKLSKIRGWLTITPPKDAGFYPYHLTMRNKQSGKVIDTSGVKISTPMSLSIEANEDYLAKKIDAKYIYVFTIDINGKIQLVFPAAGDGNSGNKFPFFSEGMPVKSFIIKDDMEAWYPVGTDNYFLIASKEPITGYNKIFNQEGVRGEAKGVEDPNPLSSLLDMGNESTARGNRETTPATWNLIRLPIKTIN